MLLCTIRKHSPLKKSFFQMHFNYYTDCTTLLVEISLGVNESRVPKTLVDWIDFKVCFRHLNWIFLNLHEFSLHNSANKIKRWLHTVWGAEQSRTKVGEPSGSTVGSTNGGTLADVMKRKNAHQRTAKAIQKQNSTFYISQIYTYNTQIENNTQLQN